MSRILWIGDAGTRTGFSRATHSIGERLAIQYDHDVHVLAVGFKGEWPVHTPLHLYGTGVGQYHGLDRVVDMLERVAPDVVITIEDPPVLMKRLFANPWDKEQLLYRGPWRVISYMPVDGINLPPEWLKLAEMVEVVPYTRFGAAVFGVDRWVYHGIETDIFRPVEERPLLTTRGEVATKAEIREKLGVPEDAFIIGRIDTNSGRKDWPATWRVVEQVSSRFRGRPVMGMFHTKLAGPGVNLKSLGMRGKAEYHITNSDDWPDEDLAALINCFDVFLTTTRGEGFGLTIGEALACGVPVVGPKHSSLPEVVGPGGVLVEPARLHTSPYGHDLQLVDTDAMAEAVLGLAADEEKRQSLGMAGLEHVRANYSWDTAASQFHELIEARGENRVPEQPSLALVN